MDDIKLFNKTCKLGIGVGFPFLIILMLFMFNASYSTSESFVVSTFNIPFDESVKFTINSRFGYREDPFTNELKYHSGVDLGAPPNTLVLSSADGVVYKIGYDENGFGNYIYIEHNYDNTKIYTMYGHLLDNSILVTEGEVVQAKQPIATIGSTGRSTGIHLHFLISKEKATSERKYLLDPMLIINGEELIVD